MSTSRRPQVPVSLARSRRTVIRLHPDDGVVVAAFRLVPGDRLDWEGVVVVDEISAGHKVAVRDIAAGHLLILRSIVVPMVGAGSSTVAVITFIFVWNEFVFALVLLSSERNYPLPLGLNTFYGHFSINIPGIMAALTVATLPSLLFYLAAQKRVVSGLAAGALRGE